CCPTLVLPCGLIGALDPFQWRQVLLHELAHIKRGDLLWGWVPEIARLLYWFHPVAHWAANRIRLERELACDAIAMAHGGLDAAGYAAILVQVVSHASQPQILKAAVACARRRGRMEGASRPQGTRRNGELLGIRS